MTPPAPFGDRSRSTSPWQFVIPAAALTIAVLMIVVTVIAIRMMKGWGSSVDLSGLPAPRTGTDRIPTGSVIKQRPENCGLSAATVAPLTVQERPDKDSCSWSDPQATHKSLTARVSIHSGTELDRPSVLGNAADVPIGIPVTAAMSGFDDERAEAKSGERKLVTGLGDEGFLQYEKLPTHQNAAVIFRVGNAEGRVSLEAPLEGGSSVPPEKLKGDALKAAAEISESLSRNAPHVPSIAPDDSRRDLATPGSVCRLVPEGTVSKVITDSGKGRILKQLSASKPTRTTCGWGKGIPGLVLTVAPFRRQGPADGTRLASREYARLHTFAREAPVGSDRVKYFTPVSGLGDQAFAAYAANIGPVRVVFRKGNLLVEAIYNDRSENNPAPGKDQIKAAYTVAEKAATRLPA